MPFAHIHPKLDNLQKTSVETRIQSQILIACYPIFFYRSETNGIESVYYET